MKDLQHLRHLFACYVIVMHGHCYGYHIIPGSEGRKNPAASLYAYSEVPPDVVLYDFACSLSEYVHNRESGFFASTRFYHDIFHGFTRKLMTLR